MQKLHTYYEHLHSLKPKKPRMQISLAENQQFYIGEDTGLLGKTPE
jgi:hypothetical protein